VGIYDEGPQVVIWEMTKACALACRHCRAEAIPRRNESELTTLEAYNLIDEIASNGRCIFILTGGDPFMRPDIFDIVSYANGKDLSVAVSPSGTGRLTKASLERLAEAGCRRMSLSIDGPNAEVHDAFRGVKGTFDRTMTAAAHARAAGIDLQINTTISKHNERMIDQMPAVIERMDAAVWTAFFLVPTGRAQIEDSLDADGFERVFGELFEIWKTDPKFMIKTTEGPHYRRYVKQHLAEIPTDRMPRHADYYKMPAIGDGKGFVFVSHTGEICPSGFLEISAGNVRTDKLLDVYRNDPMFQRLRDADRTNGKCGLCDYRGLCGGSRARAYGFSGDPFGPEPCCSYKSPAYLASLQTAGA
jgi:radical SAM protein